MGAHRGLRLGLSLAIVAAGCLALADARSDAPALAVTDPPFQIDDIQIGVPWQHYLDPEFIDVHGQHKVVYTEGVRVPGPMWVADLDPVTGDFVSGHGRDVELETDIAPLMDTLINGPEWGADAGGLALFYTKADAGGRKQVWRVELGNPPVRTQLTHGPLENVQWAATLDPTDARTRFFWVRYSGEPMLYWADEDDVSYDHPIPGYVKEGNNGPRFIPGTDDFVYSKQVAADKIELVRVSTVDGSETVVTDDAIKKVDTWGFPAPEFGGEVLYSALVSETELGVYRYVRPSDPFATRIATITVPAGDPRRYIRSVEIPQTNLDRLDRTWFAFLGADSPTALEPCDGSMWIASLGPDPADRVLRRVDEGAVSGAWSYRQEPELLIGRDEVFLYYNAYLSVGSKELRRARTGIRLLAGAATATATVPTPAPSPSPAEPGTPSPPPREPASALHLPLTLARSAPHPAPGGSAPPTATASATPGWVPVDAAVGVPGEAYLDPELGPGDYADHMAFLDARLDVWLGIVDPATGRFASGHGRDLRLGRASAFGTRMVNGPEWGLDAAGPAVYVTAADTNGRGQIWRVAPPFSAPVFTQLTTGPDAFVHAVANATWHAGRASTLLAGYRGQQDGIDLRWRPGTVQPFWLDEAEPGVIHPLPFPNKFHRWIPDTTLATFAAAATGDGLVAGQVYLFDADASAGSVRQVSADAGIKASPWGFHAPELGGELSIMAVVDDRALAVYRDLSGGTAPWARIATLALPAGTPFVRLTSAEPVLGGRGYAGRSWFTVEAQTEADDDSAIWLLGLSLDGTPGVARRLDEGATSGRAGSRRDPESYAAAGELLVYYSVSGGAGQLRVTRTGVKAP